MLFASPKRASRANNLLSDPVGLMCLSVVCFLCLLWPASNGQVLRHSAEYLLSPRKLNLYLHQSAVIALLKAKTEQLLREVSLTERIVSRKCLLGAGTPVQMAKCVSVLIRRRDSAFVSKSAQMQGIGAATAEAEGGRTGGDDLLSRLLDSVIYAYQTAFGHKMRANVDEFKFKEEEEEEIRVRNKGQRKVFRRHRRESSDPGHLNNGFAANKSPREGEKRLRNIQKLRAVQHYYELAKYCSARLARLDRQNSQFLREQRVPLEIETEPFGRLNGIMQDLERLLAGLHFQKMSVLSPRIFSLFGRDKGGKNSTSALKSVLSMSPTLFSFSHDGFLSLPELFETLSLGQSEVLEWLDLMLRVTRAEGRLDRLLERLKPKMRDLRERVLPAVRKMAREEKNWNRLRKSLSLRQQREMDDKGYTFLSKRQRRMVYADREQEVPSSLGAGMASNEAELEDQIHLLASIEDRRSRTRRQTIEPGNPQNAGQGQGPGTGQDYQFFTLAPYAFTNQLNQGSTVQGLLLSPAFWTNQVLSPDIVAFQLLSPSAFYGATMSANVLAANILSPTAFGAQILSPDIVSAYILSPDILLAQVLAPNIVSPRIASPQYLSVQIISPNILVPRWFGEDVYGINILSPNILSPRYNSSEKFMLDRVLSPHLLGGEHETSSEEESHAEEDRAAGKEVHQDRQHGGNKDAPAQEVAPGITELGAPAHSRDAQKAGNKKGAKRGGENRSKRFLWGRSGGVQQMGQ